MLIFSGNAAVRYRFLLTFYISSASVFPQITIKNSHLYRSGVCSAIVEKVARETPRTFQVDLLTCSQVGSAKSLCRTQVGSCDIINIWYENCSNLSIFFCWFFQLSYTSVSFLVWRAVNVCYCRIITAVDGVLTSVRFGLTVQMQIGILSHTFVQMYK